MGSSHEGRAIDHDILRPAQPANNPFNAPALVVNRQDQVVSPLFPMLVGDLQDGEGFEDLGIVSGGALLGTDDGPSAPNAPPLLPDGPSHQAPRTMKRDDILKTLMARDEEREQLCDTILRVCTENKSPDWTMDDVERIIQHDLKK